MKPPPPDLPRSFDRPVYCILGLPFDALTMNAAVTRLTEDIVAGRRCLLATPNVNFLATAWRDAGFRESVLASDLSVADGMPIVWIARLLGLPLRERVAGAGLFDALLDRDGGPRIRCYFFGGEEGVAEQACRRLNERGLAMSCAGALNPGFGSVETLSDERYLAQINSARPDFLVVALGAAKGQAWIMANARRLEATVISHLGAVVGFHAGAIRRAPAWMQRLGLEWLYRIDQEPLLARRYLRDGLILSWLLLTRVLPLWAARFLAPGDPGPGSIESEQGATGQVRLVLRGSFGHHNAGELRRACAAAAARGQPVTVDLSGMQRIDAAFTGAMLVLKKHCDAGGHELRLAGTPRGVARMLRWQGAGYLLR